MIVAQSIIAPMAIAGFLAIALLPLYNQVLKVFKYRVIATSTVLLTLLLLLGGLFFLIFWQFKSLHNSYPEISQKILAIPDKVDQFLVKNNLQSTAKNFVSKENVANWLESGSSFIFKSIGNIGQFTTSIALIPIYIFLFLYYKSKIKGLLVAMLNFFDLEGDKVMSSLSYIIQHHLKGLSIVTLLMGVANSVGLYIIGVPYAIALGFFTALCTIIPYIGIILGSIPVLLISYATQGSFTTLLFIVGWYALVQFLEGNFLTPKIVGNEVNLNPLASIIALIIGGSIWGIVGMILAIPATALVQIIADQFVGGKPLVSMLSSTSQKNKK